MDAWTRPDFVEIKMDAEIGSYQEDSAPLGDEPPVARDAPTAEADR